MKPPSALAPRLTLSDAVYGRESRDRLSESGKPAIDGARAALETFYAAFNHADLRLLRAVWLEDPLVQLNNPLGGQLRGLQPIIELYSRVFHGPGQAWVRFEDVVEIVAGDTVVFVGSELGEYNRDDERVALRIRTSRFFGYTSHGWRQVHHHGSIDDSQLLASYQDLVTR